MSQCEVAKTLAERDGMEIKSCADCPWADECARNEDPEIPY